MKRAPVKPNIDDYIDQLTREPDPSYYTDLDEWWEEFTKWDNLATEHAEAVRKGEA